MERTANSLISMTLLNKLATWGSLVKFSHSVFALPFALMMVVFVSRARPITAVDFSALILCIVAARTAAMGFNRWVDAEIDKVNPRTVNREIPKGLVSKKEAGVLIASSSTLFLMGAWLLGHHCVVLAPAVLGVLFGYSLVKRYSSLCHLVLGVSLSLAPGGVWYALTAEWSWQPVPIMVAVALWVAGFDILYSCQDESVDRELGLFSIPRVVGAQRAIGIAALLHGVSLALLVWGGALFSVGAMYYCGVALFGALIASQYVAIQSKGIACVDQVFFTRNGAASVMLFTAALLDRAF
jgi:4-hydroxybenzoate polyprenyltransferase